MNMQAFVRCAMCQTLIQCSENITYTDPTLCNACLNNCESKIVKPPLDTQMDLSYLVKRTFLDAEPTVSPEIIKAAIEHPEPILPGSHAIKADSDKLPWDLLPMDAVEEIVKVLRHGANKYAPRNWEKGMAWGRLIGASFRHLVAFCRGYDTDEESGLPHLAHLGCCVLFLISHQLRRIGTDDRVKETENGPEV